MVVKGRGEESDVKERRKGKEGRKEGRKRHTFSLQSAESRRKGKKEDYLSLKRNQEVI